MMGMTTAIWEKYVEFKHEWLKITTTALVSPLLYLIALGWGLGASSYVADMPYIDFLVPGIIALTTMNNGFSSVGLSLNVQRLFEHSFAHSVTSLRGERSGIAGVFPRDVLKRHAVRCTWNARGDSGHDPFRHIEVFHFRDSAHDFSVQHLLSRGKSACTDKKGHRPAAIDPCQRTST